jgi:hypothetical protein
MKAKEMKQKSIVCTVFEGHYHKGVAALVNSLYVNGYEGAIWIGYKGNLPPWAKIQSNENGIAVMSVCDNLTLHFVLFPKEAFLPYSKPDFMLEILEKHEPQADNIFYIDCDIVVKCRFSYLEEWITYGVALCEDMNSPFSATHPLRYQWARYFEKHNITVKNTDNQYVNGGFVGVQRSAKGFLETWQIIQALMMEDFKEINGIGLKDPTYLFHRTDQDALNIVKDVTHETLSIADRSAMDFSTYGYIMSHAAGKSKPWANNWLLQVVKNGLRPSWTDRIFMNYTTYPLSIYSNLERFIKKTNLKLAIAIGRVVA